MLLLPAQHNEQQPGLQFAVIQVRSSTRHRRAKGTERWEISDAGVLTNLVPWLTQVHLGVSVTGISSLIVCNLPASHPLACACLHLDLLCMTDTFYIQYTPPPRL